MTGPTMVTLNASGGSVPAREVSCSKMKRRVIDQPGPPYSFGHSGAIHPFMRIILRDEGTHLIAKRGVLPGKAQLHHRAPATTSRRRAGFHARRSRRRVAVDRVASKPLRQQPDASGD